MQAKTLTILAASLFSILSIGCSKPASSDSDNDSAAEVYAGLIEYKYSELHQVEDFTLTERNDQPFGLKDLKGKVWITSFFFSRCKAECSQQNQTISSEVHAKLVGEDFVVVSITCDPLNDSARVLNDYAKEYTVAEDKWKFLTGDLSDIQAVADDSFKVVVNPTTHTKRLLMVDKWGRFRDSFEWKDPKDLKRLVKTAKMLANETEQPADDEIIKSRAIPQSAFELTSESKTDTKESELKSQTKRDPSWPSWRNEEWLTSFELTDSTGKKFRSEAMKGKVWVANFFFSNCTGACPKLLGGVKELRSQIGDRDITFVSLSNDPKTDTPEVLDEYAKRYRDDDKWLFLTGEEQLQIRAIGSEFFDANAGSGQTHSEKLIVVDKWGKVRGYFKYDDPEQMVKLRLLLDDLLDETEPPKKK